MGGFYVLVGSILEKYGKFRKNCRFSGRISPDWGNTTWADLAGLGSVGLSRISGALLFSQPVDHLGKLDVVLYTT